MSTERNQFMKIVILDGYALNPGDLDWSGFEKLGSVTVYDKTSLSDQAEIIHRIGDADIVLTNKTPITREILDACPDIRYIGVLATGYNVVDTAAAADFGIPVTNVPAYGTAAVAQFAIAMLLEICSGVAHHSQAVQEGRWEKSECFCFWDFPLIELAGKTMGIIGMGAIGLKTAEIARALDMQVVADGSHPNEAGRKLAEYVTRDELFRRSDVIALHCPLTRDTEGMINRDSISRMKDGVIILNNARGPLIVEQDLADALQSGKVRAAGLDVVCEEPIQADNPLLHAPNCLITPHISWAPVETRSRLMDIAVENLKAFRDGKQQNVVNEPTGITDRK